MGKDRDRSTERDDDAYAAKYEDFVRRTFNCDRSDVRYPYADSNVWVSLINKWNFATDPTRSKNSQGQRTKEFEVFFKSVQGYFEKTIEHVLKKHASKGGNEKMFDSFTALQTEAAKAKSVDELRAVLDKCLAGLDEFGVVLK